MVAANAVRNSDLHRALEVLEDLQASLANAAGSAQRKPGKAGA